MSVALLALGLLTLLVLGATAGPWALGRLTPTFARHPRAAIAAWTGSVVLWVLGLLALGPLLAWLASGPMLPGPVGAVCRRCLEAANPFGTTSLASSVPPATPLLAAAGLGIVLAVVLAVTAVGRRRQTTAHLGLLRDTARRSRVGGEHVWLVTAQAPAAYTLPRAGVVLSSGAVASLDADQLGAVLAHEHAHLRGRHHLVLGLLGGLRRVLGVVPLVRAAPDVVAAYAEMAADDAALRTYGKRALAGALLALHRTGGPAGVALSAGIGGGSGVGSTARVGSTAGIGSTAGVGSPAVAALHAGASHVPSRVARLAVAAAVPPPDRLTGALVGTYLLAVAAAVLLVVGPYATVLIQGAC